MNLWQDLKFDAAANPPPPECWQSLILLTSLLFGVINSPARAAAAQAVPESLEQHQPTQDATTPEFQESGSDLGGLRSPNRAAQDLQPAPLAPPELLELAPERLAQTNPLNPGQSPLPASPPADPELGNLRLEEIAPQPPPTRTLYLQGGINYFRSNNIFASLDPVDDGLIRAGLGLLYIPALGPDTYLVASAQGNVVRYFNQDTFSYNEVLFDAGIYQQLSPTMYGQLGWTNQQLFTVETGERFLSENALRLTLGRRDPLADRLTLTSFYQLRWGLADPDIRSRVVNYLGVGLNYDIQPDLQAALEYQLALTSFTRQSRSDTYNQIVARLSYQFTPEARVSLIGGYSFGSSSDPNIRFDGSILGITLDLNVPLF